MYIMNKITVICFIIVIQNVGHIHEVGIFATMFCFSSISKRMVKSKTMDSSIMDHEGMHVNFYLLETHKMIPITEDRTLLILLFNILEFEQFLLLSIII